MLILIMAVSTQVFAETIKVIEKPRKLEYHYVVTHVTNLRKNKSYTLKDAKEIGSVLPNSTKKITTSTKHTVSSSVTTEEATKFSNNSEEFIKDLEIEVNGKHGTSRTEKYEKTETIDETFTFDPAEKAKGNNVCVIYSGYILVDAEVEMDKYEVKVEYHYKNNWDKWRHHRKKRYETKKKIGTVTAMVKVPVMVRTAEYYKVGGHTKSTKLLPTTINLNSKHVKILDSKELTKNDPAPLNLEYLYYDVLEGCIPEIMAIRILADKESEIRNSNYSERYKRTSIMHIFQVRRKVSMGPNSRDPRDRGPREEMDY